MTLSSINRTKMAFALVVGILYIAFAAIEAIVALGVASGIGETMLVQGDLMNAFVLVVIGSVFLYGVVEFRAGMNEGVAYVYVGIVLALVFAAIYLLIMGADALSANVIGSEDLEGWTPLDDMRPGLYLAVLPFIGMLLWRDRFRLSGLSKAGK